MRSKIAIAVSSALLTAPLAFAADQQVTITKLEELTQSIQVKANKTSNPNVEATPVFTPEADLDQGKHRYFVRLKDSPVALYEGGVDKFAPTANKMVNGKLNVKSKDVVNYRNYLSSKQQDIISRASNIIDAGSIKQRTNLAYNGFVIEMTQAQAERLAKIGGIAHIKRETKRYLTTDSGPAIIKAPSVWDGSATGTASKGEGKIVGIIDTGINTDHPSFADVGGDGYDHTNPWGSGNYSGDCATEEWKHLCNDKLIGVHSYTALTDYYQYYDDTVPANGEDHNGHGSHTAGTAAGNVLNDVSLLDVNGDESGVKFEQVTGVAPHANIVSYQVCFPGENDAIGFSGCWPSLTILAVEHAIENGIDALNYSIGGGSSDPWNDADSLAFLAARKAGIHVATSAGNSGPGPETVGSPGDAPWITTVAAYTHDRVFTDNGLSAMEGGDTAAPADIVGQGRTVGFTGDIVYAGDYTNANDPDGDPAQCLQPFPAETFPADTIVVCDRGAIARVDKGRNVLAGGASGLVLANLQGGASSVVADSHVLPAAHINADDGDALKAWLASGEGHKATIDGSAPAQDATAAKIAAGFTSRGPNRSVPNVIKPSIAAPGVSIFAAYADDQSAGFKQFPDPSDWGFLSGTSMASPHIAGALTLLSDIHPSWTPAQIESALMLTADQMTYKEDGVTMSDFFDMGNGYANIEAAAKTGLVMDESYLGYMQANPSFGGKPENMNIASMANAACVDTCTWTRTVTATQAADWTATTTAEDGVTVTVSPESFSLDAGESQELTITADVTAADEGWSMGNVVLTSGDLPVAQIPYAVKADGTNLPNGFSLTAPRAKGQVTYSGLVAKGAENVMATVYDKQSELIDGLEMSAGNDEWTGISMTLESPAASLSFYLTDSTSPDYDLYIIDPNGQQWSSAYSGSNESVSLFNMPAGTYSIWLHNYEASAPDAIDTVLLHSDAVFINEESKNTIVQSEVTGDGEEFSITFNWDSETSVSGAVYLTDDNGVLNHLLPVMLVRTASDVSTDAALSESMTPGEASTVSFEIAPNFTQEDKVYTLTAKIDAGHEVANISHDGAVNGDMIEWEVTLPANGSADVTKVSFDLVPRNSGEGFMVELSNTYMEDTMTMSYTFGVENVAPVAAISGPSYGKDGEKVTLSGGSSSDANNDTLMYSWQQTRGAAAAFNASAQDITFTTGTTPSDDPMVFTLTVTDSSGETSTTTHSVGVKRKSDGGSMAWLTLLLVPMLFRRKLRK